MAQHYGTIITRKMINENEIFLQNKKMKGNYRLAV